MHTHGTMMVIEGPRFSTRAESRWFISQGWDTLNMTGYPEAVLARELEICYVNVSLITDFDVGVEDAPHVSHEDVIRVFSQNNERLRNLLFAMIPALPAERDCVCATAWPAHALSLDRLADTRQEHEEPEQLAARR